MTPLRTNTDGDARGDRPRAATHEPYFELCALATTGTLSDQEWNQLKLHLSQCRECSELVQKYREISRTGMALLISEEAVGDHKGPETWTPQMAKNELFARIARGDQVGWSSEAAIGSMRAARPGFWARFEISNWRMGLRYGMSVAAAVLVIAAVYRFGIRKGEELGGPAIRSSAANASAVKSQMQALESERASRDEQLQSRDLQIRALAKQVQDATADLVKLTAADKQAELSLQEHLQQQGEELSQANARNTSVAGERDAINAKLQDAEASLASMKTSLDKLREERSADLLFTTSLQTRIDDLSARLKKQDDLSAEDAQMLASDRDIRELMGARDLYIADVFDVDANGRTEKPFGRVFYTRNKSLIFYAFDLDKQRGVRTVSAFQAWGRRGIHDDHPVNMGIFYLDNETNRRWVLKFDDAETLARIDTVFVTVEPKGGSQEPRGKPLLVASLRSQPNHP